MAVFLAFALVAIGPLLFVALFHYTLNGTPMQSLLAIICNVVMLLALTGII